MEWWVWLIIALGVFVIAPLFGMLFVAPRFVFNGILSRSNPKRWSRNAPSDRNNPDILAMWDASLAFQKEHAAQEEEIHVTTQDGLRLAGLYYDFGSDTAVLILGGRPETAIYGLYYAYPYAEKGINVCCPDSRAHGNSEGRYSGCGFMEQYDLLAFMHYLHEEKGIKKILLHGICVGSSAMSFLLARKDCPSYVIGVFTDGMYESFYGTMKIRIHRAKGPVYPTIWYFRHWIKKMYGYDMKKDTIMKNVAQWRVPTATMIASKTDVFSLPQYTQQLYDTMSVADKHLEWWENGIHSHLRIQETKHYDETVYAFIDRATKNEVH